MIGHKSNRYFVIIAASAATLLILEILALMLLSLRPSAAPVTTMPTSNDTEYAAPTPTPSPSPLTRVKLTDQIQFYGCTDPTGETLQTWDGCAQLETPVGTSYTPGPCLIDDRDNKTYAVRKFADGQCWLVTNLAYGGDTAYGDEENYGLRFGDTQTYGYLYPWDESVGHGDGVPIQGLCPEHWHIPTLGEFQDLHARVGEQQNGFWQENYAWHGILAGYVDPYGVGQTVDNQGSCGLWWTATYYSESGRDKPYSWYVDNDFSEVPACIMRGGAEYLPFDPEQTPAERARMEEEWARGYRDDWAATTLRVKSDYQYYNGWGRAAGASVRCVHD